VHDRKLQPDTILAVFQPGRILDPLEVERDLGIPHEHHARRRELRELLAAMVEGGWLVETVSSEGQVRYCPTKSMLLKLPPSVVGLLERIANALEGM
jgi:hypothetical protein